MISLATAERPFSFDGDGAAFQLACEAKRIDLAVLFDPMMAVHTSNVEPLPHQITAVYESMLPRQPLRFVLADDPGAGKTIMAGIYIRELIMRADSHRILIVAPGSLVEQWRDELFEKFGLEFHIYSTVLEQTSPSGNPFDDYSRLIVRLDQLSRNEELQQALRARVGSRRLRRSAQARRPLLRLETGKDWPVPLRGKTRRPRAPPPADDRHAAQRQGRGGASSLMTLRCSRNAPPTPSTTSCRTCATFIRWTHQKSASPEP